MMNINDVNFFDMTTKKVPWSKKITPIIKTFYDKPEFVETSRVLTYKPTGEKYKVMVVKPGGFYTEEVGRITEYDETFMDDDSLDKIFTKLTKKSEKKA